MMSSEPSNIPIYVAAIAAITSLIAAMVSAYVAHKVSGKPADLQLANFRREWIEKLRLNIAKFLSLKFQESQLSKFTNTLKNKGEVEKHNEYVEKLANVRAEAGRFRFEIGLMLNTSEVSHSELDKELDKCLTTPLNNNHYSDKFLDLCRKVLKNEWDTLKTEMKDGGNKR